jgi:hypothetical protein
MSRPDAAASAALDIDVIRPGFFVYLDILGEAIRFNTLGVDVTIGGSGFEEMDGQTFIGTNGRFIDIGSVEAKTGGSEQLNCRLSGLRDIDNETLNIIGDPANWQGRTAMLWRMIRDEAGAQMGAIQHYYTGYMTSLGVNGDPEEQSIELAIEGYLAAFGAASNRSYLDQELFDPGDLSARAAIAIANGVSGSPLTNNTATGFDAARAAINSASAIAERLR